MVPTEDGATRTAVRSAATFGRRLRRQGARVVRGRSGGWPPVIRVPAVPECRPGWVIGAPSFVGLGAQKSGTTWWFQLIRSHPQVTCAARKELHFFDRFWNGAWNEGEAVTYHSYFPRPEGHLAGEWSTSYLFDPWTPPLLRSAAPESKLLVLLRDPVERYHSGLLHYLDRGAPPHPTVAEEAVQRGLYGSQLRQVLRVFPSEQVLILQYEACRQDPGRELARTLAFLGADPDHRPVDIEREVYGRRGVKPVLEETLRRSLAEFYQDDVLDLAGLAPDLDLELWPHFRHLMR